MSAHEEKIYAPLHRQREARDYLNDQRLREILSETIEAIDASVAANYWLLVVQRLEPMAEDTGSMPLHLSENFGAHNIYASGLTLNAALSAAKTQETSDHLRNQIVVGLCCALENAFTQMAEYLGAQMADQSKGIASDPVRKWAGIRDLFQERGGQYSHGFQDDCLLRLQKLFWARNRIVHHNGQWSSILEGYPTFWKKADRVQTNQDAIDAIIQWLDNELLHGWRSFDAVWAPKSLSDE